MKYPEILRVDVSQYCIDNGRPENLTSCPIALAVRKMFPDADISVDGSLYLDDEFYRSEAAMSFVASFDGGEEVYPQIIEFALSHDED